MRYRTQVAIEIFLYDSESEGEKLELDLCLWEASMSRLDYARYSEKSLWAAYQWQPLRQIDWESGIPDDRRKAEKLRDGGMGILKVQDSYFLFC